MGNHGPTLAIVWISGGAVVLWLFINGIRKSLATSKQASASSTTPRSQYSDDSETELARARDLMAGKMTCDYCGEINLPGMKCAQCGAVKKLASK